MSTDILDRLREYLIETAPAGQDEAFRLSGLWNIDLFFQPSIDERFFRYGIAVAQCQHQGACYSGKVQRFAKNIIGRDARTTVTGNRFMDIAILDAAFSSLKQSKQHRSHELTGSAKRKAEDRAHLIANQVERLMSRKLVAPPQRVAVIGAIGCVIHHLRRRGFSVRATDLENDLIGEQLAGVTVEDGRDYTLQRVAEADVAVVTGMTLATKTLDAIIKTAQAAATRLVVVAETGAWFAPFYVEYLQVDSVVSEPFPFYVFAGTTECRIFEP